jgi:hypothetical protein
MRMRIATGKEPKKELDMCHSVIVNYNSRGGSSELTNLNWNASELTLPPEQEDQSKEEMNFSRRMKHETP